MRKTLRWKPSRFGSVRQERSEHANHGKPLYIELVGGLGNQLFGYAAGYKQAERLGVPLVLTYKSNVGDTSRQFELSRLLSDRVTLGVPPKRLTSFTESSFLYDPLIDYVCSGTLLKGYFQSYRYFLSHEEFRTHLHVTLDDYRWSRNGAENDVPFIAVHIRGGDYRQAKNAGYHGILSADYYKSALNQVRSQVGSLPVVIFSDDEIGVETGLSLCSSATVFVEPPEWQPIDLLMHMASAQGFVLSNSSFSWWAAWLSNVRPVVVPEPWFRAPGMPTVDLIPTAWGQANSNFQ